MKRFTFIPLALAALLTLSCQKNVQNTDPASGEIILTVNADELGTDVDTKTTAVNSLPASLYWGATTGSGSESTKWASASGTVSAGKISTGKYQTATPTTYNYYLSNVSMSIGANTTVSATGGTSGTDVICGRTSSSNTAPTVTMNHVFARTGNITTTCANGSLTSLSYTIKTKGANTGTSGTYNLRTGAWSSTSGLSSDTAITGSSDMYVIPGSYTIAVTATYTRGDYVVTKTMSGDVTLTGGKINNISLTWPEGGTEIKVIVSLAPWEREITDAITKHEYPSFGGVNIAPGPLLYTGTGFVIQPSWKIGSNSILRLTGTAGSVYLRYEQLGKYFSSQGDAFTLGSGLGIDNQGNNVSYNGYDDWRMPTYSEYDKIINGPRTGSSVDGTPGCRYAFVKVTGYNFDNMGDPFYGLLLFPDNVGITTPAGGISCNTTAVQEMSISLLNYIINKGCVFLPACGSRNPVEAAWRGIGTICYYHCATSSGTSSIYCLQADNGIVSIRELTDHPEAEYMPIRLVRNAE